MLKSRSISSISPKLNTGVFNTLISIKTIHKFNQDGKTQERISFNTPSKKYTNGDTNPPNYLEMEFDSHDEIFGIIKNLQDKKLFQDERQAAQLALGLKLFSEVLIKNRQHPLFNAFTPAFAEFMKNLKAS